MEHRRGQRVETFVSGCSFCDVGADKGSHSALDMGVVMSQIECLPVGTDGKKIPFELIDENPLPRLPHLLDESGKSGFGLSQINLILRADWFLNGEEHLRESLRLAGEADVRILLSSVGFESFDNTILRNLNKGLSVETNLRAVRLMRLLKEEFPSHFGYSRRDGAIHGFIHPTPWDTNESAANIQRAFFRYSLLEDIIPSHSTPLIIHHASGLADWIRAIEQKEGVRFKRYGSIIGWWEAGQVEVG
jgi:hypothetical protein